MTERIMKRKQTPPSFRPAESEEDVDSDSDSVATDSTVMSEYDADKIYEVEQILAEREGRGNSKVYLIKWAHYPDERASWEPDNCILDKSIIASWKYTFAQQKAGKLEAFDVAAWESNNKRLAKEKEERQSRRKEKCRRRAQSSGVSTVTNKALIREDSDDEPVLRRRLPKAIRSAQASDEDNEPLSFVRRASTDKLRKKKKTMVLDHDESDSESDARGGQERKTSKSTKETQKRPEARTTLYSSANSPDAGSPPLGAREFSRTTAHQAAPSRPTSHSTQEATRPPSGDQVVKRPRGRPPGSGRGGATRGGTRGRGRSGALPATSHVFSKSEKPKMTKPNLMTALGSMVPASDGINQPELSKNLSHRRKLENAGRAIADRAPDLAALGGLVNPSKIGSRAYPILKPQDHRQPETQTRQPSGNDAVPTPSVPPPPLRRASTNRVRFLDDSDDGSGVIFEEPALIVENQGDKGQSRRESPFKGQMVEYGVDQPDAPDQSKLGNVSTGTKPKPILRTPTPNWSTSNDWTSQQHHFPRPESISSTTNSNRVASNEWAPRQPLLSRPESVPNAPSINIAPTQTGLPSIPYNQSESARPALDRKASTGERKKVSLSEYNAKQRIERGGNLVQQASFGTLDIHQTMVAFMGIPRSSQEPWVKEISSLAVLNFVYLCLATDFQAKPSFAEAKVLHHGSVATNADTTITLDRLSEHLRLKLGGLVFSHHSIAILLFPTRLAEWKFLETTDVPNTVTLRYHIFELPEFCPTISGVPKGITPPEASLSPPYWASAVEFLCALNYESLLPSLGPPRLSEKGQKKKEPDRDNFFLLIPENATPSRPFLTTWLKSCKPECKVLTSQEPGSWDTFIKHARRQGSAGTVLIHESLISQIPKLPELQRLFSSRCNFSVFSLNNCPAPHPSLSLGSPVPSATVKTRLFPLGGAFFLAPSLLIADPKNVWKFLRYFKNKQEENSTPGTYKLVGCHRLREFLLDIANEKAAERVELYANARGRDVEPDAIKRGIGLSHNQARYEIYKVIDEMLDKAAANLTPYYDLEELEEEDSPIIYAPEHIAQSDEPRLLSWFAGWALANVDRYKKFWFVGTDPNNIQTAVRISPKAISPNETATDTSISEVADLVKVVTPSSSLEHGLRWNKTSTETAADTSISEVADLAKVMTPSSPLENGVRWKKTGFTAVTEVAPAPLFSTVAALSRPHVPDDVVSPLTRSPVIHQAATSDKVWHNPDVDVDISSKSHETHKIGEQDYDPEIMGDFENKIGEFVTITGANDDLATDYLAAAGVDLEVAVELYRKALALAPSALDEMLDKIHEFIRSTGLDSRVPSNSNVAMDYLALVEADVKSAVELYKNKSGVVPSAAAQVSTAQRLPSHPPLRDGSVGASDHSSLHTSGSRPPSRSGIVTEEDGRRVVPQSIRGNGSTRKELNIRPGHIPPEDREAWRSPTLLAMLPRNVKQSSAKHATNSSKGGKPGTTITRDESGDVVMSDAHQDDLPPPPAPHRPSSDAQILPPPTSPSGGDGTKKRTESSSTGIFVTEDERTPSRGSSPYKQDSRKTSSSQSLEATTELYKTMEENGRSENHIRVLGIREVFHQLAIK